MKRINCYYMTCTLIGVCNKEFAEFNIRETSRRRAKKMLKNHIKYTYPKNVAYKWAPFSLRIVKNTK